MIRETEIDWINLDDEMVSMYDRTVDSVEDSAEEMKTCRFNLAWVGKCGRALTSESEMRNALCGEHLGIRCKVCGEQALRQCGRGLSVTCGRPICNKCKCRHEVSSGVDMKEEEPISNGVRNGV